MFIVVKIIVGVLAILAAVGNLLLTIAGVVDKKGAKQYQENSKSIADHCCNNLTTKLGTLFNKEGK